MRTKENPVERHLFDEPCHGSNSFQHRQLKIDIARWNELVELVWRDLRVAVQYDELELGCGLNQIYQRCEIDRSHPHQRVLGALVLHAQCELNDQRHGTPRASAIPKRRASRKSYP